MSEVFYILIKEYPNSPELGTEVSLNDEFKLISQEQLEKYPEFWKKIERKYFKFGKDEVFLRLMPKDNDVGIEYKESLNGVCFYSELKKFMDSIKYIKSFRFGFADFNGICETSNGLPNNKSFEFIRFDDNVIVITQIQRVLSECEKLLDEYNNKEV